ncbi:UPF0182 family protein [Mycetocola reblochoni]|uniref:UPF0182 protein D9V30_05420 n=1 Tax=Mycetocola reblochoni TaxID=331618 RepID=A0A3L6ZT26_9MICO|nr:UPF0182 family protein [Mycetocola reblochoni]
MVGALIVLFFIFSGFYTDFLWFDQLGFSSVLVTQWLATAGMFLIGFVAIGLPVAVSLQLAYRLRPVYARLSSELDRYQEMIEPLRRFAMWGIPALLGLFGGFASASNWQTALLWWNRTETGQADPQFGLDTSFYLFELPFYQSVVAFASAAVLFSAILAVAVGYLYGAIRVSGRELRISKAARIQIAVTAGIYLLLQAVSLWLDRFATLTSPSGLITGANYTDVTATIPGHTILAGIAIVVALLFFVTAVIGRWRMPIVGTALLVVSALLIGTAYPWAVQRFQVVPNQRSLEAEYIQRNIDMTREAYGVDEMEEIDYDARTDAEPGALRADAETTANIRIIDPSQVGPSVSQLQQFRAYYRFPSVLDVDRYEIDGQIQDTVVAVRDINQSGLDDAQSWDNTSVVYTHGFGMVAAYGNQRSADGQPVFLESGIPSSGELGEFEPRIYFGENSPAYSIVGAPEGTTPIEMDYPSGEAEGDHASYTFSGDGGPTLDNIFKKVIYALKFQSEQIVLSDAVNDESQILYDRKPLDRVKKVAPYLTLDKDPYPSVVDGEIVWIVDGYTTSATHPYSRVTNLTDTLSEESSTTQGFAIDDINYIRNSVKATVNAYDGSVTLYAWDTEDPVLQSWQKIFPSTTKPISEMSGDLLSHVRYPTDMFKVQRSILGQYHVTEAGQFYSRTDAWVTPDDPQNTQNQKNLQAPYYLSMQMPGQDKPSYSLYSTYIPATSGDDSRNVLTGYLAADANAGSTDGEKAEGYGKLRLLTLTSDTTVPGPGQVQNNFNSDPTISAQVNILKQGQSEVINGNLLTLPVGGGLLYVQPVYVKSSGNTSYPLLQKVLVAFGDDLAFEDTLDEALDTLFGGDSGANAGDDTVPDTPGADGVDGGEVPSDVDDESGSSGDSGSGESGSGDTATAEPSSELTQALNDAKKAMSEKDAAMADGDWAAYGEADKRLNDALTKALELSGE